MKSFNSIMLMLGVLVFMSSRSYAQAPQVTLGLVESAGGCGLATDCASDFICFDIEMTVDQDKSLDSYNIWLQYDNTIVSRVNGGDDNSCVLDNGGDTNIEGSGGYRVAGIPGTPYDMTAGVTAIVHTICFNILNPDAFEGSTINVGGTMFGVLETTVTFDDASNDVVPELFPLVMTSQDISCLIELPVEFLSFDAKKRGEVVDLNWKTVEESNNSHFDVERSIDGKSFEKIGTVHSKGSGVAIRAYDFTDVDPELGENYYRLKQEDIDGRYDYSEIRSVIFHGESGLSERLTVYPNPVVDHVNVIFKKERGSATIQVLNANGKLMETKYLDTEAEGNIESLLKMSDYASGTYFIKLIHQGDTEISQVVKVNE